VADNFVVRVKYRNGFVDVSDGNVGRRRMIPFDAGNTDTAAQATAIGQKVLAQYGFTPRRSVQANIGDTPSWPVNGDAIDTFDLDGSIVTQRLLSRRVTFGDEAKVRLDPTLSSPLDEFVARQTQALRRLTNGTVGGRASGSSPFQQVNSQVLTGVVSGRRIETFSFSPITETESPEWEVPDFVLATKITATLNYATTPDITFNHDIRFELVVNGVNLTGVGGFLNVPAGNSTYSKLGTLTLLPGDKLKINCVINDLTEFDLDDNRASVQFTAAPNSLLRETASKR
jgi:hypothetical protein